MNATTPKTGGAGTENPGVAAAKKFYEAVEKWAARDPDAVSKAAELITERAEGATVPTDKPPPAAKRAICLAGGGPAAGLHIGALKRLKERGISFDNKDDVWALSCIGAWVGIVYNQATKDNEIEETREFFRGVFRDDKSFRSFPMNTIFATDWAGNAEAILDFMLRPVNYRNAFLPREINRAFLQTLSALRRGSTISLHGRETGNKEYQFEFKDKPYSAGDFNRWALNDVLAVHPVVRFLTAMIYKSKVDGLSRLYYPDSSFLNGIQFDRVRERAPFIYYNAWNLSDQKLVLFANKPKQVTSTPTEKIFSNVKVERYRPINAASLCACSALPYIEKTVTMDGKIYCEGALIDTVNFENLLQDHPDLEEIWISRIVDANQVLPPRNLHDSLANLCELFCATVGEDDIEIFKYRLQLENKARWEKIKIVEIPVDSTINFEWSHSNLEHGIKAGEDAAERTYQAYMKEKGSLTDDDWKKKGGIVINPDAQQKSKDIEEKLEERVQLARKRLSQAGRAD
jgi:predicted acylesterase/phospholipase RssA